MPHSSVGSNIDIALDTARDFTPQIAFDTVAFFNDMPNIRNFIFAQGIGIAFKWNICRSQDICCSLSTDPVDIGQTDLDAFIAGSSIPATRAIRFAPSITSLRLALD